MDGPLHLFDCINYPQVTWTKKKDDCDGFAILAAELLHRWNLNPVLVTTMVRPVRASYTVCVFMPLCNPFINNSALLLISHSYLARLIIATLIWGRPPGQKNFLLSP